MRVTNMLPDMQYAMQQSQQALNTALQQMSTGLRVNQLSDDPSASANMVISLADSANVDQYTKNVTSLTSQMQTADSALSGVVTALNSAITAGTSGANGINSAANRQSIASEVQGFLSTVVSQANTPYQGSYLFAGTASNTPPFVAASATYTSANGTAGTPLLTTTALTAGSVTTISDAVTGGTFVFKAQPAGGTGSGAGGLSDIADLQAAINTAVTAGTLSAGTKATINATTGQLQIATNSSTAGIVVSSNDAALGSMSAVADSAVANAYAYVGNTDTNEAQVGDSLHVATNVSGDKLFGSGTNVIASLTNLINALKSGTTDQIGTATSAVSAALASFNTARIPLDNTISQLNAQDSYLGKETLTLKNNQNSLTGISTSDAATNLSQATLANNAVLAAAAKALPLTLLDYLK